MARTSDRVQGSAGCTSRFYFKTKRTATFEEYKIDDLFALLLIYADATALRNNLDDLPSHTLSEEYRKRKSTDWNFWV